MLSLQSREGVELRASVGTALARAMLKQSGHSDAQIEAMEARPVAAAVEGQSVGSTHIHIASAPAPAATVEAPSTDVQIAPLRPMETTGLRDEIADLSTIPNVSEAMRQRLIESRVQLVCSVNSSLAGIAEARLDGERLDNEIKRKSTEAEERRAEKRARIDHLKSSVALINESGGMSTSARYALNRELLGVIGEGAGDVQVSADLASAERATAPLAVRQTVVQYAQSLTATPITDKERVKQLRVAVERTYASMFGKDTARTNSAHQIKEKLPKARVASLVHTYEVARLKQMHGVFERFL